MSKKKTIQNTSSINSTSNVVTSKYNFFSGLFLGLNDDDDDDETLLRCLKKPPSLG